MINVNREPNALIVGGGPAGLAAAIELQKRGVQDIIVIDRDDAIGGLPRFCHHLGFGFGYSHRLETGPSFVRRLQRELDDTKVRILTSTTLISVDASARCTIVGPQTGITTLVPSVVILATGIREANRGNLLIPGARPTTGIWTTGLLQQLVSRGVPIPNAIKRIAILGTEHVAFSAIFTAAKAGLKVVAMIEDDCRVQSYRPAAWLARMLGVEILLNSRIETIFANGDILEGAAVTSARGTRRIAFDALITSGNWIPETASISSTISIDPVTGGPHIDQAMRTSTPGVLAAGNMLRGVETSGWAAFEGQRAGRAAALILNHGLSRSQASARRKIAIGASLPQYWGSEPKLAELAQRAPVRFIRTYQTPL